LKTGTGVPGMTLVSRQAATLAAAVAFIEAARDPITG